MLSCIVFGVARHGSLASYDSDGLGLAKTCKRSVEKSTQRGTGDTVTILVYIT